MPLFLTNANSTNVRDHSRVDPPGKDEAARAVAVALLGWILAVAGASFSGVLAKLSEGEWLALAGFAAAFAWGVYRLDAGVRAYVQSSRRRSLLRAAIAIDATVLLVAARWLVSGMEVEAVAAFPFALAPLVLVPLAVVVHAAQIDGQPSWRAQAIARGARNVRSAVAKGPARSSVAT